MSDYQVQIDVIEEKENVVWCNLYTGVYCAKIAMAAADYKILKHRGFFIRDGKERDSANVLNTSLIYYPKEEGGNQ